MMIDLVTTFTASILIWLMFLGLIILWVIDGRFKKELVLHAIVASIFAWLASIMLKDIFHSQRPYLVDGAKYLVFWIPKFEMGAFPSTHAAASFALSLTIWFHDRKIGFFYLFSSTLIGIARVLANVHYPIDIIGGAVVGIIAAILIERVHIFPASNSNRKLVRRRKR